MWECKTLTKFKKQPNHSTGTVAFHLHTWYRTDRLATRYPIKVSEAYTRCIGRFDNPSLQSLLLCLHIVLHRCLTAVMGCLIKLPATE
eukprot:578032-Amphidinium_carterae.1